MLPTRRSQKAMNSRALRASTSSDPAQGGVPEEEKPTLDKFVNSNDWAGVIGLMQFERNLALKSNSSLSEVTRASLWLAFGCVHYGDYNRALEVYDEMMSQGMDFDPELHAHRAVCMFYLGNYAEAELAAKQAPPGPLQNRVLFHISQRQNDETKLMTHHEKLTPTIHDQLSLAAMHFVRGHFQEATDIYKRVLLENREYDALNVYVAMCYYRLDYFDVASEILQVYVQKHPSSMVAVNLKACNAFKLYNGKAAEAELKPLADSQGIPVHEIESDLVKHNLVVFRNGENAQQMLTPLMEVIPEARLNLVLYHIRNEEIDEAYSLIKDLEPTIPEEYILKGVVLSHKGQASDDRDTLKMAQQYFQLVGSSTSHCDTIPGRQAMSMCFFLLEQFEDVLIYLRSIKSYMEGDEEFNYNYGITCCQTGNYREAEEHLLSVNKPAYKEEYQFISALTRTLIHTGKPNAAWEHYLRLEAAQESFLLLQMIANDCYKMGHFYHAMKAFDVLERLDPSPEYWEGKRGAAVGVFQMVIAGKERMETLREAYAMMTGTSNPQSEYVRKVMAKWAKENGEILEQ